MLDSIVQSDRSAMVFLNMGEYHGAFLDSFFWMVSDILVWLPVLLLFLYVVVDNKKKESVLVIATVVVMFLLCDQLSSSLLKPTIARLRPSRDPYVMDMLSYVREYRGGQYGFPSSHAANSFGFMMLSSLLFRYRPYTVVSVAWASLCAYSRIYLGVHFPLDILCGIVMGLLLGYLCYRLLVYLRKRFPAFCYDSVQDSSEYTKGGFAVRDVRLVIFTLFVVLLTIISCSR